MFKKWLLLVMSLVMVLSAVPLMTISPVDVQAQDTPAAEDDVLYVALIWHQHQPVYYKDPETGLYNRPWVRVHAAKDYLDMAAILEEYPDIKATFNITPSLIRQLDDLSAGAKDLYWAMAEIPAEALTDEQKQFLLERFFDINPTIIARFPRYQELADMRSEMGIAGSIEQWTAQDFRDLQVLFNLAWTDPDWLAQEPLAALVEQGRDFEETDKALVFAEHLRLIQETIPYHAQLQQSGQIEVTMTPYAHPILPLLVDSNVAAQGLPGGDLPPRFFFEEDAVAQVQRGIELYEEHFGMAPRGMWPAEGSVSPAVIQMIADAGIQWIATDEEVLARSLPDLSGFTRNSQDTVQQADMLYRPYLVTGEEGGEVAILFRDHLISDKVGFEYSEPPGAEAAGDFVQRLENIREQLNAEGAEGPHLVTVLLDGENAWEYYENDGKEFLHTMYQLLSESETIVTVTPTEYLAMTAEPRPIDELWAGSWINPTFDTWIGEEEENLAWDYLRRTRMAVRDALPNLDPETAEAVMDLMYIAEGSDWFWWYGSDQNSGVDYSFDQQFRGFLRQIYELIGDEVPAFVDVPIVPQPAVAADQLLQGLTTPTIDGAITGDEWGSAAYYDLAGDAALQGLYYSFDEENFYLRIESADAIDPNATYSFYLRVPESTVFANAFPHNVPLEDAPLLGFGAKRLIEVSFVDGEPVATLFAAGRDGAWLERDTFDSVAISGSTLELGVSLAELAPAARPGNLIDMRLVVTADSQLVTMVPAPGPVLAAIPDQGVPNVFLTIHDPVGDDFGPGTYTYPTNPIFAPGAYDAESLVVGYDDEFLILQIAMEGPLVNDWGAPNGMGILTIDVYIDQDGAESGARLLLPGRNAAVLPDHAWDYAIFAEGWEAAIFQPSPEGAVEISGQFNIISDPGQRTVTINIPRSLIQGDPTAWSYLVTIASQDGFPSPGVLRLRNVVPVAEEYLIGGGTGATNETRLLDVIMPEDYTPTQAELLSSFPPSEADVDTLTPDDFAQLPMFAAE